MRWFFATAVLLMCGSMALAGKPWPRPAAGPSASGDPELILTFDDGPHETHTPQILDELERRGVKATFYWVGHRISGTRRNVDKRRAVAQRAVRAGHLVGNHTIDHAQLCRGPSHEAERQIDENEHLYEALIGMPLLTFRAPYGAKCNRLRRMLSERNMDHFHWDMDPHEWLHHDVQVTLDYVKRKLRRLEGRGVLLLHDTKKVTVRALPLIFDWIEQENAHRVATGRRPIRILSYVDLAREQLAPGLEDWAADAHADLRALGQRLAALVPGEPVTRIGQR